MLLDQLAAFGNSNPSGSTQWRSHPHRCAGGEVQVVNPARTHADEAHSYFIFLFRRSQPGRCIHRRQASARMLVPGGIFYDASAYS